jgi:hypothetical protein
LPWLRLDRLRAAIAVDGECITSPLLLPSVDKYFGVDILG